MENDNEPRLARDAQREASISTFEQLVPGLTGIQVFRTESLRADVEAGLVTAADRFKALPEATQSLYEETAARLRAGLLYSLRVADVMAVPM